MKVSHGLFFVLLVLVATVQADPRMWGEHGIPVRQGMHLKWYQVMARDDYGNTLLVWAEKTSAQRDIRAQLINSSGQPQWTAGGVNITPETHFQDRPVAVAVDGGWIIAWADFRDQYNCGSYWDYYVCAAVYAQKLDYSGNRLWPDNDFTGAMINPNAEGYDKFSLRMVPDAAGGAIIAWNEWGTENGVHAQRVTPDGSAGWPQTVLIPDSGYISDITVAPGSDGSMLVVRSTYQDYGLRVARISPDGSLPWGVSGVQITGGWNTYEPGVVSDGADGCYVIWGDSRNNSWRTYAQHVAGDGQPTWEENGIPLSAETLEATVPDLALSMSGDPDGMVAVWSQQQQENQYAVYAQKISPEGTAAWAEGGLAIASLGANNWEIDPQVTTDYNGGLVTIWRDNSGSVPHCLATRVRSNGTFAWGNNPVPAGDPLSPSSNSYYRQPLFGIAGSFGTYFVAYVGVDSLGMEGLRYQLLDHANGTRLLGPGGMAAVSGVGGDAILAHVAPMSDYRTVVLWTDGRFSNWSWGSGPLYYQIVAADGQIQRTLNGERLVPNNTAGLYMAQYGPQTCDDGLGGLFVGYLDYRTGASLIRVSHIGSTGDIVGPDSGMVAWLQDGQQYAFVCPDEQQGCYVAWTGYNAGYSDYIYVMRLNSSLQRMWNQPVQLTDSVTEGYLGGLVASSGNCCIAVWAYGPYDGHDIMAAGICADGSVAWSTAICQATGNQTGPVATSDGEGGAYIVWDDARVPQNGWDIYAQRITGDGVPYWTANGVAVYAGAGEQSSPQITLDSGENLSVVWSDSRESAYAPRVYAQRISPQGTQRWNADGVRVSSTHSYQSAMAASSRDGIFAFWGEYYPGIYGTHVDSTGAIFNDPFWTPDTGGVIAEPLDVHDMAYSPLAVSDGWGGCVAGWVKWEDEYEFYPDRGGELYTSDVYVQRLFDYTDAARGRNDALPREYALYQNYPNPFNPVTRIAFDLPQAQHVTLAVYDLLGRQTASLIDREMPGGKHAIDFDASALPSGLFIYRLQAGSFTEARKLVVLK